LFRTITLDAQEVDAKLLVFASHFKGNQTRSSP